MSDDFNIPQAGASPPMVDMPGKKPGLLSSTGGKVVAIIIGLGALAIIAGIVIAIVVFVFGNQAADKFVEVVSEQSTESTSTAGTSDTTTEGVAAAAGPAKAVANEDVFTFRDIFAPLLVALPAEGEATTDGESTTDTETPTTEGTLYLDDIVTEDGELKAVLTLDGQTYTLGAGESIPGTPWQVLRVTSTQVTMLYGDTQVVLTIGQGITK